MERKCSQSENSPKSGGHSAFYRAVSSCSKNDLAPSSGRVERAVDTCFHRGMTIIHHNIDSGGPDGDPEALVQNVPVRLYFSHTSTNFQNAFREAAHDCGPVSGSRLRILKDRGNNIAAILPRHCRKYLVYQCSKNGEIINFPSRSIRNFENRFSRGGEI